MLKKLWNNIKIAWNLLFVGMRHADNEVLSAGSDSGSDGTSIEEKQEDRNLYAALLRGEVTQEVVEKRYEMYEAERRSHQYEYSGGGNAHKKNTMFDYQGDVENSENARVVIVQENRKGMGTLESFGVGDEENAEIYKGIKMEDISTKENTIQIERDFMPRFRLEEFAKKIVIKKNGNKTYLDIYVSKYPVQFDRRSRMFLNAAAEIVGGYTRSEIVDFKRLSFIAEKAYGAEDLTFISVSDISFTRALEYGEYIVFKFLCKFETVEDLTSEFFSEEAEAKSQQHAARESAPVNLDAAQEMLARDSYDTDSANELLKELKGDK